MVQSEDFNMPIAGCCDDPGLCIYDICCPCLTIMEGANNIGDSCACVYCLATLCGLGCCVLSFLGHDVADKRGIPMGMGKSCCCSLLNLCTCYSCRVVNESRLYKANPSMSLTGPKTQDMKGRG